MRMEQEHEDAEPTVTETVAPGSSKPDGKRIDRQPSANVFHPMRIEGEPLSATIIRERRERPY
jgi:hypothetical protein